jgi:two-component system chemotaxis response regulator CheY
MAEVVLIVDPDIDSRQAMVTLLGTGLYQTVAADGFAPAARLLESTRPNLLITVVRLGQFNGLHLVVRGRAGNSRMAALVIDDSRDPVLAHESKKLGATAYLVRPVDSEELLRRVAGALAGRERRHSRRTALTVNLVVYITARRVRLLDISDSGCRLEFSTGSERLLPAAFWLELPNSGLSLIAERVWSRRVDRSDIWLCGAALFATNSEMMQRWRQLVETLRQGTTSGIQRS